MEVGRGGTAWPFVIIAGGVVCGAWCLGWSFPDSLLVATGSSVAGLC